MPAKTWVPGAPATAALAGDQARVEHRRSALHDAIDADALAEADDDAFARQPVLAAPPMLPSACSTATRSRAAPATVQLCTRLAARAMVKHAADQQEEQQRTAESK